jgi:hypothetical protein
VGEINYKYELETLLDIVEQAITGIDFENRTVLGFAPLDVLRAAVERYRMLLPDWDPFIIRAEAEAEAGEIAWECSNEEHISHVSHIISQRIVRATMCFCPFCGLSLGETPTTLADVMQANSFTVTTGAWNALSQRRWQT